MNMSALESTQMVGKSTTSATVATPAVQVTESLFTRLIVAPVLFISFLISLFLVDSKTYKNILGGREPTDDHYHSHQNKLARQEMADAFQLRNKIVAGFAVVGGVGVAALGYGGSKVFTTLFSA